MARRILRYWRPPKTGFDWDSHERVPARRIPREMVDFVDQCLAPANRTLWPVGHDAVGFFRKGTTIWIWWRCVIGEGAYGAECRMIELTDSDFQRFDAGGRDLYKELGVTVYNSLDLRKAVPTLPPLRHEFSGWPGYLGVAGALYTSIDVTRRRSIDSYFSVAPAGLSLPDESLVGFFFRKDAPAVPDVFRSLSSIARSTVTSAELQDGMMKGIEEELQTEAAKPVFDEPYPGRVRLTGGASSTHLPSPAREPVLPKVYASAEPTDSTRRIAEAGQGGELAVVGNEIHQLSGAIREMMDKAQQQRAEIVQELEKLNGRVQQLEQVVAEFIAQQRADHDARNKASVGSRQLMFLASVTVIGLAIWNIIITSNLNSEWSSGLNDRLEKSEKTIVSAVVAETAKKWREVVVLNNEKTQEISVEFERFQKELETRIAKQGDVVTRATAADVTKANQAITARITRSDESLNRLLTNDKATADSVSQLFKQVGELNKALEEVNRKLSSPIQANPVIVTPPTTPPVAVPAR